MAYKLDIVVENELFVAINKPSGLLSVPDRENKEVSLKSILREKYGDIFVVHRLDRDTSGLILFAKTAETQKQLSAMLEERQMEKFYLGLVQGTFYPEEGTIDAKIAPSPKDAGLMCVDSKNGKIAITDYKTLEQFKNYSLVSFQIHTGRTHQIRVHSLYLGHSIVCDPFYGNSGPIFISEIKRKFNLSKNEENERPIMGRLALHSWKLNFELNSEKYSLEAEPPKDIRATLAQLRKHN